MKALVDFFFFVVASVVTHQQVVMTGYFADGILSSQHTTLQLIKEALGQNGVTPRDDSPVTEVLNQVCPSSWRGACKTAVQLLFAQAGLVSRHVQNHGCDPKVLRETETLGVKRDIVHFVPCCHIYSMYLSEVERNSFILDGQKMVFDVFAFVAASGPFSRQPFWQERSVSHDSN